MRFQNLLLPLLLLGGCASHKNPDALKPTANTRAIEQVRMRAVTSGDVESVRGAQVLVADPDKAFDPSTARFGRPASYNSKSANTQEFHFMDRVRTKSFTSREYASKSAWMGDSKFATKEAPAKTSWFARKTAASKTYDTKESRDASKVVAVRGLHDGERPFLVKGRRQAALDANGAETDPYGNSNDGPAWMGELKEIGGAKPLTMEQVKRLLNKN